MVGIPVFAGFSAKLLFAQAAVLTGRPWKIVTVMLALALSSLLNAMYFIRALSRIYSDETEPVGEGSDQKPCADRSRRMYLAAGTALLALNVFLGLFSWVMSDVILRGLGMFA